MTTTPTTPATVSCPSCGTPCHATRHEHVGYLDAGSVSTTYVPIDRRAIDRRGGVVTDAMVEKAREAMAEYDDPRGFYAVKFALEAALGSGAGRRKMKRMSVVVRGKLGEYVFPFSGDPRHLEAWRADGLEVYVIENTVPEWVQILGMVRPWCFLQDLFNFKNPWGKK